MYNNLNDYELLDLATSNEEVKEMLFRKYKPIIVSEAQKFYALNVNSGLEFNDFIQEGMYGLSNAIDTFKEQKNAIFYTYAKKCISNALKSCLKQITRQKYIPLNSAVSLDEIIGIRKNNIHFILNRLIDSPERNVESTEHINNLIKKLNTRLTVLESQVFELKIDGFENNEINMILETNNKQIYNALDRIKSKIKKIIKE